VISLRLCALLIAANAAAVLTPMRAEAQWWSLRGPADFEECADIAEKATSREARASELSQCRAKFAGRRKPGGGYSYFDFMQNRSFDIAGPNPTPQEQKHIDEQYSAFLDRERRASIAAALAKQQQLQQASLRTVGAPASPQAPVKPALAKGAKARAKSKDCEKGTFSCEWPRLAERIQDLKKALFGPPSSSKATGG
jgi:hypothetical protein